MNIMKKTKKKNAKKNRTETEKKKTIDIDKVLEALEIQNRTNKAFLKELNKNIERNKRINQIDED